MDKALLIAVAFALTTLYVQANSGEEATTHDLQVLQENVAPQSPQPDDKAASQEDKNQTEKGDSDETPSQDAK